MQAEESAVSFQDVMRGRHSVRVYDPSARISDGELRQLIAEATLAPSAHNLQTWRYLVVTDPALRAEILPLAGGQQQVVEASALILVLGDVEAFSPAWRERILDKAVREGKLTNEEREEQLGEAEGYRLAHSPAWLRDVLLINGALAAMQLLLAARARGWDTVPMLGYDQEALQRLLHIPPNLVQVLMIALGRAAETPRATVRLDPSDVTFWNRL